MLKLSENPPIMYPEGSTIEEASGSWWVAHTKSRNEKTLAWSLQRWDIPYFLPLLEKKTRRNGRNFTSLMPLFSGYVFFNGNDETRYQVLTTNRVAQIIEVFEQEKLIRELGSIHQAIITGNQIDPHPYLTEGTRCRVIAGSLKGCEGMLVEKKNTTRIVLQVDMLGQGASMEIDADLLEPIDE